MSNDDSLAGHELVGEAMVALARTDDEHPGRGHGKQAWELFNRALTAGVGAKDVACCKAWMGVLKKNEAMEQETTGDAIMAGGLDAAPLAAEAAEYFEEALRSDRNAGGQHFADRVQRASALDGHAAPLWVMHARHLARSSGSRAAIQYLESRAALMSHLPGYYPPLLSLELGMQYMAEKDKVSAERVWQSAVNSDTADLETNALPMQHIRNNIQVVKQPDSPPKSGCAGVLFLAASVAAAVVVIAMAI